MYKDSIEKPSKYSQGNLVQGKVKRVCADCGYKDSSLIPPAMCPMCHNNPDSPLAPKNAMVSGNRKSRRKRDAELRAEDKKQRKLMEKVNKQIAAEGGKYEAS